MRIDTLPTANRWSFLPAEAGNRRKVLVLFVGRAATPEPRRLRGSRRSTGGGGNDRLTPRPGS